jgi:hypothetical protein
MNVALARCFSIARIGSWALAAGRGGRLRGVWLENHPRGRPFLSTRPQMQLETAASAFVCGLVRKDVRACPIVARLAAPDHPFHAIAVPPGPLVVVRTVGHRQGGSLSRWCGKYRRASRDIEHLGSAHTDAGIPRVESALIAMCPSGAPYRYWPVLDTVSIDRPGWVPCLEEMSVRMKTIRSPFFPEIFAQSSGLVVLGRSSFSANSSKQACIR